MEIALNEIKNKYEEIIEWLSSYKEQTKCRGVVIGISGGKDSSVVAMLAKKVWRDEVLGILMPNGKQQDLDDSIDIVSSLNVNYRVVNIETVFNSIIRVIENRIDETYISGEFVPNCPRITDKARTRLRMTILYAVAQTIGYRVIGTGNASEAYIGWTTKWGDSAYDLNPIAHLTCTEVMALGELLADELGLNKKYVVKSPSDGLCGKTDEDSFGFTYDTLDGYISGKTTDIDYDTVLKIEKLHQLSEHKRNMPATLN